MFKTRLYKTIFALIALLIMGNATVTAQVDNDTIAVAHPIKVSLITYYPGNEVFEVYGHTEILLSDSTGSYYVNYGVFDFNSPNFIARYIMGETDYLCAIMPPRVNAGIKEGRKMVEQNLNLTPSQAQRLWDLLAENVKPQNREYRYRHFSDNCSTRARDIIESALGEQLDYTGCDFIVGKTLRQVLRHYTRNYAWDEFGIDLVMGAVCDTIIDARTQTFTPLFLMHAFNSTMVMRDGKPTPFVSRSNVIVPGDDNGIVQPPTPWYITPMAAAIALLAITILITLKDWRRRKVSRWFDTLLFTIAGLAGCIIFFIEFISTHEATMPNYNILWLHPLQLLLAILPWSKRATKILRSCHLVNIALIATMLVIWLSGLQVPNAAFFPIVGALLMRSITAIKYTK